MQSTFSTKKNYLNFDTLIKHYLENRYNLKKQVLIFNNTSHVYVLRVANILKKNIQPFLVALDH